MVWRMTAGPIGSPALTAHDTTKMVPLGTIIRAHDPTFGEGEFIYLLGVGSTVVGSVVTYDATTWQTVLSAVAGAIPRPIAIAMAATVASEYGWYQISGIATASKLCTVSVATGIAVGVLSTGTVAGTSGTKEIFGAVFAAVSSATAGGITAKIMINRPHKQGRVT